MTYALQTSKLGKRYGKHWALRDCTLHAPRGCIAGLIGLNGAGKTTLLHLAVGLLTPTTGTIQVLDAPANQVDTLLPRLGFVSQERSLYREFTIHDTLTLGRKLNPSWDVTLAESLLARLKLPQKQKIGRLSGGQQTQVALVMALAKRPELLLLDEPFAHLDPLAKREITRILMELAAERSTTMIISSHSISDLENICDYFIVLSPHKVQLEASLEQIIQQHRRITGPREHFASIANTYTVVEANHTGRQSSALIRTFLSINDPHWRVEEVSLEDIIIAYLVTNTTTPRILEIDQLLKEVTL